MPRRHLLAAGLLALVSVSIAYAQLGPKDGVDLKPTDLDRVKVGDQAPDFTLENSDKQRISLSDFRGKKNVLLYFSRGHW